MAIQILAQSKLLQCFEAQVQQLEHQLACFVRFMVLELNKQSGGFVSEETVSSVFSEFVEFQRLEDWKERLPDWYLGRDLSRSHVELQVEDFGGDYNGPRKK